MRVSRHVATSSALGLALTCAALTPAAAQSQTPAATAAPAQLPTISVQGAQQPESRDYKVDRSASPKNTEPLLDTPQSITIVPKEVMEERGATTLRDVLRTVPGVTIAAGEGGGPQGDNLKIRGFAANNDLFIDGMRDPGQYNRDPFNLEQVEVSKGASATSSGRGATGGTVNLVTKTPQKQALTAGSLTFGSDRTRRATADFNQPLDALGLANSALRLNVMGHTQNVEGRDAIKYERWGIAPSFAFGLGTPTRGTISYFHLEEDNVPDYGLPVLNSTAIPATVRRENFYGFQSLSTERVTTDIGTFKLEHDFNDKISARNQLRLQRTARLATVVPPRSANVAADTVSLTPTGRDTELLSLANQTDVTLKFATGPVGHTVVTGIELARESYDNQPYSYTAVTGRLSVYDWGTRYTGARSLGAKTETVARTIAVYAMDTAKIGEQWEVVGGIRYDRFDAETKIPSTRTELERTDNLVSWRGALVYKPVQNVSLYGSVASSYNPSAESLALNANNTLTAPEKNLTYEVGAKWDVFKETLSLNAAIFRVEKTDARETLPGGTVQVLSGVRRVDGFEVGVAGHLTDKWQIFGGYTFQNSEIVDSSTASNKGNAIASTPRHTVNLWTTYELPWNLKIGGGVTWVADRYYSDANLGKIPDYTVFDAMVSYELRPGIDLQINANNLTDKFYIERVHTGGGHALPGAGRTVLFSTNFKF